MLLLVFANRDPVGTMYQDVGGHQYGVSQQAGIYVLRIKPYFVFERCRTFQFTLICQHIEEYIQFAYLGNAALNEKCRFFRIKSRGQVFGKDDLHIGVKIFSFWVCGKGMEVGYKEKTFGLML